jgi:TonB family protein
MKIVACFERDGLTTDRVEVDFVIGTRGNVTSTRTASSGSRELQRCVASVFAKLTFAPPAGGPQLVHYPVQLCFAGQ